MRQRGVVVEGMHWAVDETYDIVCRLPSPPSFVIVENILRMSWTFSSNVVSAHLTCPISPRDRWQTKTDSRIAVVEA
jgi:hypothetical protein